jgi:hypothetical protein
MDGITEFGWKELGRGSLSFLTSLSSVAVLLMDSSTVGLRLFMVLRVWFLMACWNGRGNVGKNLAFPSSILRVREAVFISQVKAVVTFTF